MVPYIAVVLNLFSRITHFSLDQISISQNLNLSIFYFEVQFICYTQYKTMLFIKKNKLM